MYVTMAEIAKRAMEGGYGVTAPNVYVSSPSPLPSAPLRNSTLL